MLRIPHEVELNVTRVNTALAIDRVTKPYATVGLFAAGIIPYYTGRPAADFFGKSTIISLGWPQTFLTQCTASVVSTLRVTTNTTQNTP